MDNQGDTNIENMANQINSIINSHPVEEQTGQHPVDINSPQKASYQQSQQQQPLENSHQQQKQRPISQKQLAKAQTTTTESSQSSQSTQSTQQQQIPTRSQLQIQLSRQNSTSQQAPTFAYGESTSETTLSYFVLVSKTLCAGLIICQVAKMIFFPFSEYDFGVYHILVIGQFIMYIIGLIAYHKCHLKQIKIFLFMFAAMGISLCIEKIVLMNGSSISLYNYFEKDDYHEQVQVEEGQEDEEPRQNTLHKFKIVILHGIIAGAYVKAVCFWVFYKGWRKMQKYLQVNRNPQMQQSNTVVTETQEQFANVTHHTKNYSQATETSENKNQFSFSNVQGEQQKELFDCKVEHDHKPSAGITLKKQN